MIRIIECNQSLNAPMRQTEYVLKIIADGDDRTMLDELLIKYFKVFGIDHGITTQ